MIRPLSDLFATNLTILGCIAWYSRRLLHAIAIFALAALTRKNTLIAPCIIASTELLNRNRKLALWMGVVPGVMFLWWGLLCVGLDVGQIHMGRSQIRPPLEGILQHLQKTRSPKLGETIAY